MNPTYEAIAKAISRNTSRNSLDTVPMIDKIGLVEELKELFEITDALFNAKAFDDMCHEIG